MSTLVIDQKTVRRLLPMAECVEIMERALATLARRDAVQPLRSVTWLPDRSGLLGVMPGYLGEPAVLGIKVITVFPGNHGSDLDAHQGAILLFDAGDGRLIAILDATEITAIRTAAVSGVATRALACDDASRLAVLGAGVQAHTHVEAMCSVRDITEVRVWSRDVEHARRFAEAARTRHGIEVVAVPTAQGAVAHADVVCTTTGSAEPILEGRWLAPGSHVNAVGACLPITRELDAEAVRRSRLYVDRRESATNEAGDILIAIAEGAIGDEHILGELGEVLLGDLPGRENAEEITLFESLGLAIEDLAAAEAVYHNAVELGYGTAVDLGGARHEAS